MPALTISLQYYTIGPYQWNEARNNKRHNDWKGRNIQNVFFWNDMIVYIKSHKESIDD